MKTRSKELIKAFDNLKLDTSGVEALQSFGKKELSNLQLFQTIVSEDIKPTQEFLNSVRVTLEPIKQLSNDLQNSAKVITNIIGEERLANDILKQGATISQSFQMGNFEFLRNDYLETSFKPIYEKINDEYDLSKMDSLGDKLDRIEKLLIDLTSLLKQSIKPEITLLADAKQEYIVTKVETTKPSERILKINNKIVKFTKNAKMGELLEFIIKNATEYDGKVPDDEAIKELFGIEIYDTEQKDKIASSRYSLSRLVENLNIKVGNEAHINKIVEYSEQYLNLTIFKK